MSSTDRARLVCFGLPSDMKEEDVDDLFGKYGALESIALRMQRDGQMAFIEFRDPRAAEDALDAKHGTSVGGQRLRVEFSRPKGAGKDGKKSGMRSDSRDGGRFKGNYSSYSKGGGYKGGYDSYGKDNRSSGGRYSSYQDRDEGNYRADFSSGKGKKGGLKESYYKVKVTGMPMTSSWQDMKDFLRSAGSVRYTQVLEPGVGVGGYESKNEQRDAVLDLDNTRMVARNGDSCLVGVEKFEDEGAGGANTGGGGMGGRRGRSDSRGKGKGDGNPPRGRSDSGGRNLRGDGPRGRSISGGRGRVRSRSR